MRTKVFHGSKDFLPGCIYLFWVIVFFYKWPVLGRMGELLAFVCSFCFLGGLCFALFSSCFVVSPFFCGRIACTLLVEYYPVLLAVMHAFLHLLCCLVVEREELVLIQ